jgi:predicted DNA binding CopG/RHH family protein
MKKNNLDREEQEILDSVERGEWEFRKPTKAEMQHYIQAAKNTLKKDQRLNIRISKLDLNMIKAKAAEEGIPYQTLIASIIHKYASGRLRSPSKENDRDKDAA